MVQPSCRDTGEVLQVIDQVLTPYVGKLMASTAAVAHCRRLGIEGRVVEPGEVDSLLRKLHLGLVIFLGQEKTAHVVAAMRREIASLREVTH